MNQIADILDLAAQAQKQNVDSVLATVVRTEGSAYRQAGAMMIICADGRSVGMISGGCLEPHIIKRAFWLTRHGANVQVYQTGDDLHNNENSKADEGFIATDNDRYEDSLLDDDLENDLDDKLNFGLGCNGRIHVLFEPLTIATPTLDLIRQVRRTQQPTVIATLIKSDSTQYKIGMCINLDSYLHTGQQTFIHSNHGLSDFSHAFINAFNKLSKHIFHKKNVEYLVVEGHLEKSPEDDSKQESLPKTDHTEWLVQRICPQIRLLICGAGNDVMALVTMAKLQDWHVTVIDSRPQYATFARFNQADAVICLPLDDTETLIKLSSNALVAVMSHSLTQDRARLAVLLEHSAQYKYLGQLGPRYRTERLIKEISTTAGNSTALAQGISKLHYPIGYKLGGDGPQALALSIMAQMSAVIHDPAPPVTLGDSTSNLQASVQQTPLQPLVARDYVNDYAHD